MTTRAPLALECICVTDLETWFSRGRTHADDWGPDDARDRTWRCTKSWFVATRGSLRSWSTTARNALPTRRHRRTPPPGHRRATQFARRGWPTVTGFHRDDRRHAVGHRASPRLGSLDRVVPRTASHGTGQATSSKGGWPRAVEAAARACDGRRRVDRRAGRAGRVERGASRRAARCRCSGAGRSIYRSRTSGPASMYRNPVDRPARSMYR